MSCRPPIIYTAVPFGGVVRRLPLLLTYNTSQLRAMRVVVLYCSDQDTNVVHARHPLTLIESSFVIDGQLQGDRTNICWHVPEQVTREHSESEHFGNFPA